MKLVILTSRIPWPLDKGDKLRIYHQLRYLSNSHEIHLIALSDGKGEEQAKQQLNKYCKSIHFFKITKLSIFSGLIRSFFNGKPFQLGYFYNKTISKKIDDIINNLQPDHIYGQLVRVAEYIKHHNITNTLDLQDALSAGLKRRADKAHGLYKFLLNMEYKRMVKYESTELHSFNYLTIITEADRDLLSKNIKERVNIIPNGVEFDFFTPKEEKKEYDIVFTGNMNYPPNIMAANFLAKEVMPFVLKQRPETKLLLAGANPHISVQRLASKNISISGWMNDIRDAYSKSSIFIAPMQIGTGLQNKLLEAMSMQLPCITSKLANNALKAEHEKEILIADNDDAKAYSEFIIKLLNDSEYYNKIALNGHRYVKGNFDWNNTVETLNDIWAKKVN